MNTADGIRTSLRHTRPVLILLTLMVTVVGLILVINGIRHQRVLISQQAITQRLYLEDELARADNEISNRATEVLAKLRMEVGSYLAQTGKTRACAAAFGCPEFATDLISEASVFNRKGRRSGTEYSSLGDRILTVGEPNQYEKIITKLSAVRPFDWGITKRTDNLRPYCWLVNTDTQVICVAVKMSAFARQVFSPVSASVNAAVQLRLTLISPSNQYQKLSAPERLDEITVTRNLTTPLEHFAMRASVTSGDIAPPYWLYPALFALALGALVTGFAAATYRAHRSSVNEVLSKVTTMASISHSLRTPLANLKLYADLLGRHRDDPAAVKKFAMVVDSEASRLTTVIDNVLEIGRAETHRRLQSANPGELVRTLLLTFGAGSIPENIEVESEVTQPKVFDCDGFQQILVNLVDNALKYAPEQRVTVKTWVTNDMLYLQVRDYGQHASIGENLDLTAAYERANKDSSGFGLGLTACKIITQRNGGDLEVELEQPGYCITASLETQNQLENP